MNKKIIVNRVKCNNCEDIITSTPLQEFKKCTCGGIAIDGGNTYLKRIYTGEKNYTELSIVRDEKYLKHFKNLKYKDYSTSNKMFSRQRTFLKPIRCPVCSATDILLLKGDGEEIYGYDIIGIICNKCKSIYGFYDVKFKN